METNNSEQKPLEERRERAGGTPNDDQLTGWAKGVGERVPGSPGGGNPQAGWGTRAKREVKEYWKGLVVQKSAV